ncbi:hypothetical protein Ddc_05975 [Ditylenchus destructor]|nr:hypothetical protein Ddc_05975 [Ditylenchus destructor]
MGVDIILLQQRRIPVMGELMFPMALDYPLVISALNFAFAYHSHRTVNVAYHVKQNNCEALAVEFLCCDGTHCQSVFHNRQLLAYDSHDSLFGSNQVPPPIAGPLDVEYELDTEHDFPEWLRHQLIENIYAIPV